MSKYTAKMHANGIDFDVKRKGTRKVLRITGTEAKRMRSVLRQLTNASDIQQSLDMLWDWAERTYKI